MRGGMAALGGLLIALLLPAGCGYNTTGRSGSESSAAGSFFSRRHLVM